LNIGIVVPRISDPRRLMGSKKLFLQLAEGFAKKGHDVIVFTTEPGSGVSKKASFLGTRYEYLTEHEILSKFLGRKLCRNFDLPFTISLFRETMFKKQDTLISINDVRPFIVPNLGGKNLSIHVPPPLFAPPNNKYVRKMLEADLSVCCSKYLADTIQKLFPRVSKEYTYVHNGIDSRRFSNGNGEKCRKKLKIPPDHFVILFVGRLAEPKGVIHLVRAFKQFHLQNRNSSLILVGGINLWVGGTNLSALGPGARQRIESYYSEIVTESAKLPIHIAANVPNDELPDYYAAADVFVCPSIWQETFGLVNIEAMASGKPVIASSVGGIPEIVKDEQNGFLVPPGDPKSITQKLLILFNDENLRRSMGEKGKHIAEESFSLEHMVDGYLSKLVQ
jgi:glycosyltransferase involved in cell wall biosynthesis